MILSTVTTTTVHSVLMDISGILHILDVTNVISTADPVPANSVMTVLLQDALQRFVAMKTVAQPDVLEIHP